MPFASKTSRPGLTRLEIVVAVAFALCAVGLVVMLIARTREAALREQCKNNLRMLGDAFRAYHNASAAEQSLQRLPPSRIGDGYATWAVLLAPHLTKDSALIAWDQQLPYYQQTDETRRAPLANFLCPAHRRPELLSLAGDVDRAGKLFPGAVGDYASVAGDGSKEHDWTGYRANGPLVIAEILQSKGDRILKWRSDTSYASFTRGESYTLLVGEKHALPDHLGDAAFGDGSLYNGGKPGNFSRVAGPGYPLSKFPDAPFNTNFGSWHNGICQFLVADGTVRVFTVDASELVLGTLSTRSD